MPFFTLYLHQGTKQVIEADDRNDLILKCQAEGIRFQQEVKEVHWTDRTLHMMEEVSTGEIRRDISTADVNPHGYRR
ncbi:hypothetical protein A3SI_08786 [Nitritalea halalkaliphila LW7]|uniref:Uncharacterized protein n=1 Tax=Nitritalea halalkaliphila LW7 TaxID=1189621 RepID=I5C4N6_9BACT|nr:hypothetical protein [Nitritalea halalkaliphila]EIM76788.1 hypothetical protein A3SI_08786 [Nitritalea halalkaliphila LW7]